MYQYRVLPCPNFSREDLVIIQRAGFLTFPQFIDNGWKTKGGLRWKRAIKNVEHYHPLFFIANDDDPLKDIDTLRKHAANIILPLHEKKELVNYIDEFDWIAFPNNPKIRDFDEYWFLVHTKGKNRWWLGVHDYPVKDPNLILEFQGIDSTLPEMYAGKYGKIWKSWRDYQKSPNRLHWRILFEINVQNFRLFLDNLEPNGSNLHTYLEMASNEA